MAVEYYEHSGHFEPMDAVLVVAVWIPVVTFTALGYAAVQTWDPGGFFSVGSHVAFGSGVGWGLGHVMKWRHIRSHSLLIVASAAFAAFAWLVQWYWHLYLNSGVGLFVFVGEPAIILDGVGWFYRESDYWLLYEIEVSGPLRAFVWIMEAGVLAGLSLYMANRSGGQQDNIYCENCGQWTENRHYSPLLRVQNPDWVIDNVRKHGDPEVLTTAEAQTGVSPGPMYIRMVLDCCTRCRKLNVLDITTHRFERSSEDPDELVVKTKVAVDNLMLNAEAAEQLRRKFLFRKGDSGLPKKAY